jgi:hypothetical protein
MCEIQDTQSLIQARRDHYEALLSEAKRERLVHSGQANNHLHCRALACLGRGLVALGYGLLRRYDVVALAPQATHAPADR